MKSVLIVVMVIIVSCMISMNPDPATSQRTNRPISTTCFVDTVRNSGSGTDDFGLRFTDCNGGYMRLWQYSVFTEDTDINVHFIRFLNPSIAAAVSDGYYKKVVKILAGTGKSYGYGPTIGPPIDSVYIDRAAGGLTDVNFKGEG